MFETPSENQLDAINKMLGGIPVAKYKGSRAGKVELLTLYAYKVVAKMQSKKSDPFNRQFDDWRVLTVEEYRKYESNDLSIEAPAENKKELQAEVIAKDAEIARLRAELAAKSTPEPEPELIYMTKVQLQEMLRQKGVKFTSQETKADLIKKLND